MNQHIENPTQLRNRIIDALVGQIRQEYGGLPNPDSMLYNQLYDLYETFNGFSSVRGKRILDIACGCRRGTSEVDSNRSWRIFEPWLCRAIELLGGQAVGVDIGNFGSEKFEVQQINLLDEDPLAEFETGSFDAVNCKGLFSSPHLCQRTTMDERIVLRELLKNELRRVLKSDGRWICFDDDVKEP